MRNFHSIIRKRVVHQRFVGGQYCVAGYHGHMRMFCRFGVQDFNNSLWKDYMYMYMSVIY